ncbi:MAG: methyltransferase [Methylococcales bacterium]|nr:methyltransferase [Methylococcaceae bacterium]
MTELLNVPQGEFTLNRLPKRANELLRAWDAADEFLLEMFAEQNGLAAQARILIVNDSFGALAVALNTFHPTALSDSWLSQQATRLNLQANQIPEDHVGLINSLEAPEGIFDWVLIKAPKTLALLEDQLIRIRPHLTADSKIVVAGMIKALPSSVWKLLERLLGPTTTSLAQKKSRLIFCQLDSSITLLNNPYPVTYQLEATNFAITNHANVFSRDSLDIGTRFFLQHLPVNQGLRDIVDLGCGNGVVGLIAASKNPQAVIHFVDESYMAVASARINFQAMGDERQASFKIGDGLTDFKSESVDLILCNPPFHQQHTVGDQIAQSMFRQALRVLRPKGELWVIGNRHLNYPVDLKKLFGNSTVVAANAKFTILKSQKSK